jgi:hypothetical protein
MPPMEDVVMQPVSAILARLGHGDGILPAP